MRIWSLHPKYLDAKGLVALWREAVLAKHVLLGKTKGYTQHPQLLRFKAAVDPIECINQYLSEIYKEAKYRGYNFSKEKIDWSFKEQKLKVTNGQMSFERQHLLKKLAIRDAGKYEKIKQKKRLEPHPIFEIIEGEIEDWEVL